jgi:acyl carrier protein
MSPSRSTDIRLSQKEILEMTREEIYGKLNEVFQDVFDDEDITVNDSTVAADVDGWDSLEHINLIVAVERCFGIKFTMGETTGLKNVGEMVDRIIAHLG